MSSGKYLVIIAGATASGKTEVAVRLARELDTEVISADSRQVYREMVIGTAMPSPEQLARVKHHFIGHKSASELYNASMFESDVLGLLQNLFRKKDLVIMAGGSGLYIDAVCRGIDDLPSTDPSIRHEMKAFYRDKGLEGIRERLKKADPEYFNKTDLNNPARILKALEVFEMTGRPYSSFLTGRSKKRNFTTVKVGLDVERKTLYDRIDRRVSGMIETGLVEEVRLLVSCRHLNALNTVGYKEIFLYLDGEVTLEEAADLIRRHTRQYARRQLTWFRKDRDIRWFSPELTGEILDYITGQTSGTR